MRIEIATLFVDMCETVLDTSIIGRARRAGKLDIHCRDIRPTPSANRAGWMMPPTAGDLAW